MNLIEMTDQEFMVAFFRHEQAMAYAEGEDYWAAYREDHDYGYELNRRFSQEQIDALASWSTTTHASYDDCIELARENYDKISYAMTAGA